MANKRNPTHVANGEEYSRSFYTYFKAQSSKEISKSTLAQRTRREQEQILKQSTAVSGKENSQVYTLTPTFYLPCGCAFGG
ncbi:hypothetical protein RHGRI_004830 [Rhododendron griersonianum]|uniref:Uncharacterized protein n=1 Tax=Rhododendron griersonianum TaxID=479676 RepID=A0AAV6LBA6_9ERIC|nr:hypothetical protein RHGRI_004830 [Rhododendron griersonianum]